MDSDQDLTFRKLKEPKCDCGERFASDCPGVWEQGCDLGSNPAYARPVKIKGPCLGQLIKKFGNWSTPEISGSVADKDESRK